MRYAITCTHMSYFVKSKLLALSHKAQCVYCAFFASCVTYCCASLAEAPTERRVRPRRPRFGGGGGGRGRRSGRRRRTTGVRRGGRGGTLSQVENWRRIEGQELGAAPELHQRGRGGGGRGRRRGEAQGQLQVRAVFRKIELFSLKGAQFKLQELI